MADINQVISLGIGSPADIPHFILFGLSPTGVMFVSIEGELSIDSVGPERTVDFEGSTRTVEFVG